MNTGKIQQQYVVVVMMFFTMAAVFALRMSFGIVLTQIVYIPNINSDANHVTNNVMICPVKNNTEKIDRHQPVVSLLVSVLMFL